MNQTYPHAPTAATSGAVVVASGKRISWQAVIAGVVIALAIQILLAMLGTGIGASTVDPLQSGESPSASAFGIGAALWWGISSLIALFVGGWVAGRLSGMPHPVDGGLHGLLAWALALLATVYLVSTAAGALLSGAAGVLGTAATVTATGAAAVAPKAVDAASEQLSKSGISLDSIKREAQQLLAQTGKPGLQPGAISQQAGAAAADAQQTAATAGSGDQDFSSLLERVLSRGRDTASQVDRDALINVVVARTGVSRDEAAKRVQGWETTAEQARAKAGQVAEEAKQKARVAADATAKGVSRGMLLGFVALALGALVAWFGGSMGQRRGVAVVA